MVSSYNVICNVLNRLKEGGLASSVFSLSDPVSLRLDSHKDAYESGSSGISYDQAVILHKDNLNPRLLIIAKGWGHGRGSPKIRQLVGILDLGDLSNVLSSKMSDEARQKMISTAVSTVLSRSLKNDERVGWSLWVNEPGFTAILALYEDGRFRMIKRDVSRFSKANEWDSDVIPYITEQIRRDFLDGVL